MFLLALPIAFGAGYLASRLNKKTEESMPVVTETQSSTNMYLGIAVGVGITFGGLMLYNKFFKNK